MTRPDWRGLLLAAVALTFLFAAALTADGQTPRTLPPECSRWQPPLNYPSAPVSVQARAEMQANTGPWTATRPPEGLAPSYPTLLAVFEATWNLSSGAASRYVDATPASPRLANAAEAIRETVRPPWIGLCCDEYQSQVAHGSYVTLYGAQPTFGQETLLMARKRRTGGGANSAWWPDSAIYNAARCLAFAERPMVFPSTPPNGGEIFWRSALRSHKEVGLPLRDTAGETVTEAVIQCHFDPECDGTEPPPAPPAPPPEPPDPPACEPYEGSDCEARCERVGRDREWCLDPERETGARLLFNLCSGVCRGGEPEPPPPDPGQPGEPIPPPETECPPTAFERACRGLGISAERCRTLARWISACNPDCDPACFVPGVPSTGLNEIVMGPPEGGGS